MPIDFLFLLLRLINYPDVFSQVVTAERLSKLRFKTMRWDNYIQFLRALESDMKIEVVASDKGGPLGKINISEQAIQNIEAAIDAYLMKFSKDKLKPIGEDCYSFEKQKDYFLARIQKKLDDGFTETLVFSDSDVETGYSLFECLLILEQQKYFVIENIYNCQDKNATEYYKIRVAINRRRFQTPPAKPKVPSIPTCTEENGVGYLKFGKYGRKIKISRSTSNPYKLLHCLIEPFRVAKTIDTVCRTLASKDDHASIDPYLALNVMIRKIEYTIKELQKIPEYSKNLKIHIDKERKTVWLDRVSQ